MGADLILLHLWTTRDIYSQMDWVAAERAIQDLQLEDCEDLVSGQFYDLEDLTIDNDNEDAILQEVKNNVRLRVEDLKSIIKGEMPRDVDVCKMGPVTAVITGGMSWGDDPTDTFTELSSIPYKVLAAAGFFA